MGNVRCIAIKIFHRQQLTLYTPHKYRRTDFANANLAFCKATLDLHATTVLINMNMMLSEIVFCQTTQKC